MKKIIICSIITLVVAVLVAFVLITPKEEMNLKGTMTYHYIDEETSGISIYNLENNRDIATVSDGSNALWLNSSELLIGRFDLIVKYNSKMAEVVGEYHVDLPVEYFALKDTDIISISFQNSNRIDLLDLTTREQVGIIDDNASSYHGWTDEGNVLIYENQNNKIVCYDIRTGEKKELCDGRDPLVKQKMIAYTDIDGNLCVRDLDGGKDTIYDGNAYYYCFSPYESIILIEDEISVLTGFKNLVLNKRVLGHAIIAWDYKENNKKVIIDACNSGAGEGFSWK